MRRIAIAIFAVALTAGHLSAGGRHYFYNGGRYYPTRGYPVYGPYHGGYRSYGYSPSFSLGVYRPAAYLAAGRCDLARSVHYGRGYAEARSYPVILSLPVSSEVVRANFSDMIFNVSPAKAAVYVDGKLIGSARSFATERDRFMILQGEHELRIEHPGFETFQAILDVTPNRTLRIDVELSALDSTRRTAR